MIRQSELGEIELSVAIPFAEHPDWGIVGPRDLRLDNGLGAGVFCLGCSERLMLKRGKIKTPHFAHLPKSLANAESCSETATHKRAKHVLANYRGTVKVAWNDWTFTLEIVLGEVECRLPNGRQPDVLWHTNYDERIAVEVEVTNPKDEGYADDMATLRLPALEVKATPGWTATLGDDDLYAKLMSDKRWVNEPVEPFIQAEPPQSALDLACLEKKFRAAEQEKEADRERARAAELEIENEREIATSRGFSINNGLFERTKADMKVSIPSQTSNRKQPYISHRDWKLYLLKISPESPIEERLDEVGREFNQIALQAKECPASLTASEFDNCYVRDRKTGTFRRRYGAKNKYTVTISQSNERKSGPVGWNAGVACSDWKFVLQKDKRNAHWKNELDAAIAIENWLPSLPKS